jgi:hypothetical protein
MDLTIALERYDRHFPFFDGTVKPPQGINLEVLQVSQSAMARDGKHRHRRMLQGKFDLAEFSMSIYLMAIDRNLPLTGVPVFPRRLFSAGLFRAANRENLERFMMYSRPRPDPRQLCRRRPVRAPGAKHLRMRAFSQPSVPAKPTVSSAPSGRPVTPAAPTRSASTAIGSPPHVP